MTDMTAQTTLFCIPHAGGSGQYFAKFGGFFPQNIVVRPLELPGRGRRCREPLLESLNALGRDVFAQVAPTAQTGAYALFGHSMGALLAFLCAQEARRQGLPPPLALFVSASGAPGCRTSSLPRPPHDLSPDELWEHVMTMGGTPQCIAESAELRRYLAPVLYADFCAVNDWRPEALPPLTTPVRVFRGAQDHLTEAEARLWERQTSAGCRVQTFSGGHFYVQDHWADLAANMTEALFPAG